MSAKLKICHVVATLDTGGMENGVINISNKIDRSRFEPAVVCVKAAGSMASRLAPDVRLINFKAPEGRHPFRFTQLGRLFRAEDFSIVHTHGWGGCSLDGILGAKWGRIPLVINGEHGAFFLHPRQLMIQRFVYKLCDANLAVSDDLKDKVVQNLGIPAQKITTITNGVDCDRFHGRYDTTALLAELGISPSPSQLIIGNIGSLKPSKNQSLLLQAASGLLRDHPTLKLILLFIGDGPDRSKLEKQTRELGLEKHAHFLGLREDIPQVLSIIDLLVTVSTSEGMSNVTLEGFASEVPIVTTQSVGMSEIVRNGETGFLLNKNTVDELYRQLLEICTMPREQLKDMGKTAREFVLQHHSIDKMVQNYEEFYIKLWENKHL